MNELASKFAEMHAQGQIRAPEQITVRCDHTHHTIPCPNQVVVGVTLPEFLAILAQASEIGKVETRQAQAPKDGASALLDITIERTEAFLTVRSLREKLAAAGFRVAGDFTFCNACWDEIGAENWGWAREALSKAIDAE